jgi:hypothetical protein
MPFKDPADKKAWRRRYLQRFPARHRFWRQAFSRKKRALGISQSLPLDPLKREAKLLQRAENWQRYCTPKPAEARAEYKRRLARVAFERILFPPKQYDFSIIHQVKKVPIAISLALPSFILSPIKDAIGPQFKTFDLRRRERYRLWRARNREHIHQQQRNWDERNRKKRRVMRHIKRATHPEQRAEQARRYRQRYPDKIRIRAWEQQARDAEYLKLAEQYNLFRPPQQQ